ncbi:Ppx/GppA family phosphatase [Sphingorhabdus sp. IMCC26285]|uniref:Ppx/GppA family phosphatase n=1 Tax=Sphingorhabdus profundilacus TaxID=2509718 RepID=A0A6I4LVP1_9SPHN|nr:Ppx/GppA family phosphatase [Sphingorhabdus profundilacus]MVZ96273.1 Ppx/GppA family phosphatase [Sphingorhabdus profundilacus]
MKSVRQAVIDIGSNTVRLVVYAGLPRAPMPIYNEKSRVALGACLAGDGIINAATMKKALAALARFETLARSMKVDTLRVVATAATREAKNGAQLVESAAALGIRVEVLDGETEATAAGLGVVSDNPHANGYVGDLGGGSLELIRVADGKLGDRISLPLGTLRHAVLKGKTTKQITQMLRDDIAAIKGEDGFPIESGLPFYMIGGSWRSFARLHMHDVGYPLTILSNYQMPSDAPMRLMPLVNDATALAQTKVVASARIAALPGATALLSGVVRLLEPSELVTSIYGLREGLLFDQLSDAERREDPLIAATRFEGERLARFPFHGDALADWIAPVFAGQSDGDARLCRAACLLSDSVWNVNPEYRADHALDLALDGNWPGVVASDRAIIAAALWTVHAGKRTLPEMLANLAKPGALAQAVIWGLAIRLAQRLDGGTGRALSDSRIEGDDAILRLRLSGQATRLRSNSVQRRLQALAEALGYGRSEIVTG